jgi:molybdate transport system permease protein
LPPVASGEISILLFTLGVAAVATLVILPPGIALGFVLARRHFLGKTLVETLVALPLVLPPVATGFVLLRLFGRRGPLGDWLERSGLDIVFTWRGVVVAMAVMALPLLVRGARVAFEGVDPQLEEAARSSGASNRRVFFRVTLPLAARGIVGGSLLAFARAVGEFGATILVAGNLPGRTTTISTAIFQAVETGDEARALRLLAGAVVLAFVAVAASEALLRRRSGRN